MEQQHNHLPHEADPMPHPDEDVSSVDSAGRSDAALAAPHGVETARRSPARHTARAMLIRVCVSAVMVALSVILCRLLGFPQSGIWRTELGFLPIAFIAFLWGPFWSGIAYSASDLIGAALFTGVNPFITLEKLFTGIMMGLFFYRGRGRRARIGIVRILIAFAVIAVVGDFFIMALIFHFAFGYTWGAALGFRGANAALNFVMRLFVMYVCDLRLTTRLLKEGEKYGV